MPAIPSPLVITPRVGVTLLDPLNHNRADPCKIHSLKTEKARALEKSLGNDPVSFWFWETRPNFHNQSLLRPGISPRSIFKKTIFEVWPYLGVII